jgi:hypothetical protein
MPEPLQSLVGRRRPVSRRDLLHRCAIALVALTPRPAAAGGGKVSQAQARYQNAPRGGQRCDRCLQFEPPSACKIVEGAVSPSGSCNFFAPRPK